MKEITVPAEIEHMDKIISFIEEELENTGSSLKAKTQINVAVDEIFTNISSYAYPSGSGTVTIRINLESNPAFAEIQFIDSGIPYNPLMKKDPDTTLSSEARSVGGLGILIVKKSMDSMDYKYNNGQNILTVKKMLS